MTDKVTLTGNQRRALAAILANNSIRAAAQACGLAERTLWRYLGEDLFLQELRTEQGKLYTEAHSRLAQGLQAALDELHTLATEAKSEAVRRQAVTDWIDRALKLKEQVELEARLSALEERIA